MDYNFAHILVDHQCKFEKKLEKVRENIVNDCMNGIDIINNGEVNNKRMEVWHEIDDALRDQATKITLLHQEAINTVHAILRKHLE